MEKNSGKGKAKENMDFQGYGLKDNPKKPWKSLGFADDSTASSMLKFQCKACGKEFESMKALFGHMRHHSGRERKRANCQECGRKFHSLKARKIANCQECGRKFHSLKALTGHMRLHPVKLRVSGESVSGDLRQDLVFESITVRRKRSKRTRYNNAPNSSLSSLNESSGVVEFDQEVEDAALCLIMLSKGVRNWTEFNSFWECYDNNSDNSEIKSLHQNKEIMQKENENLFRDGDESFQMKKPSGVEFRVSKVDDESGFAFYDTEIEKRISGGIMSFRSIEVEPRQDLMEGLDLAGLGSTKSSSFKDAMLEAFDTEPGGDSLNKLITTPLNSQISDDSQNKNNKYKCRICSKTFKSHQALGGHQTIHRKSNNSTFAVEQIENCEKITQNCEYEMNGVTSYGTKGYKVHECRICFKVFASGQALGGHQRSHILKDSKTSDKVQPAKQLEFFDIYDDVIDLNLPVMHNEEGNGGEIGIGFKSCRVGNDCKSKALVSLVAN